MYDKDCFNCKFPDCVRDERQDSRDRRMEYYRRNKALESNRRKELSQQLIASKAWVDFSQGCDIRIMTEEKAEYNKNVKELVGKYKEDKFLFPFCQNLAITWAPVINKLKGSI